MLLGNVSPLFLFIYPISFILVHGGHSTVPADVVNLQTTALYGGDQEKVADELKLVNKAISNTNRSIPRATLAQPVLEHNIDNENGNGTTASGSSISSFPFNSDTFLFDLPEESSGGLPQGAFYMLNATCSENEDPTCIIDHNVTCVGDPLYCNLTYDEYMELLYDYIYPSVPEWILICSHAVVFVMGLVSIKPNGRNLSSIHTSSALHDSDNDDATV